MDFYILIFPRDTQYIVFGALLYVFLRLFSVSCIHCYRKKKPTRVYCEFSREFLKSLGERLCWDQFCKVSVVELL